MSGQQNQWLAGGYDLEIEHFYRWLAWWSPGRGVPFLRSDKSLKCHWTEHSQQGEKNKYWADENLDEFDNIYNERILSLAEVYLKNFMDTPEHIDFTVWHKN